MSTFAMSGTRFLRLPHSPGFRHRTFPRFRIPRTGVATAPEPVITPDVPKILSSVKPKLVIDGEFVDAASGKTFPVIDPRTEEEIFRVAEGDKEDIDRAVKAARRAFDEGPWPRMTGRERGRILFKFTDLLEKHQEELSQLETLDNGKPLTVSRMVDIPGSIGNIRYFATWADKICGKTIPVDNKAFAYTLHEPMGVIGGIIPWNFPMIMMAWKIAPALAAGNTIIIKCAEQTPLTALRVAEIALEAGIPKGVLNVVPGYGPTAGAALASHMDVDKIAFTGSTEVGQKIMQMAATNVKNISLELGGKSPLIVFPDANLDKAVDIACLAVLFNMGQCCDAGSRIFVHSDIFDEFVEKAAKVARNRIVGDPFNNVEHGPQVDADQFNKIMSYIESGQSEGADLVCGGKRVGNKGYYIEPTVFANVQDQMKIAREEIFGPVQSILKFTDTDEVIRRANDTKYGLAAGIVTGDLNTANRVSRSLRAGSVYINSYRSVDNALPFGGYKMSGIGRELSDYALSNYTEVKTVVIPLEDSPWL